MVQRPGAASGTFAKTPQQYKTLLANAAKQSIKQKETAKGSWWDKTTTSIGNWYSSNKTEIWTTAAYVGLGVLAVGLTVATAGAGSAVAGTILAGALTGASISAGIDAGTQYLQNDHSFDNYNPMQTLRASSVGAVSGALGGSALSLRAEVIGNATLQAVNTFGTSVATGKEATATDYLVNTATGAVAGFAGGAGVQHASATGNQVVHYIGSSYSSYASNAGLETISIFSNQIPDAAYNAVIRSGILSNFVQEQTGFAISNIRNK